MSTTIDQRVVEMRFDNGQFENNVQTSMSTLDKLKQRLNLTGASKGLENVSTAAKNVNLSGLKSSVETMQAKFSAFEVVAVTALTNLTNSAINAGKQIVSALTIDPITTGFEEYETKMDSIQTILSNTESKGATMADVTEVINELNTYADKTIYNFQEMTKNIGTFTAAGVGLEESASAIQGIANLAAMSGSTSQQASTAMYQLSQALAAGTVKLQDWNSVVNAGMGGEKFQTALKETARECGISVDSIIEKAGSFRDSLSEGWLTAEVLTNTLKKMTVEGATEYANQMVTAGKYTDAQAKALIKEAQSAEDAATKVKTLTQLWDTLKEAAQSGWGQTWEIIVGDFEKAKELFTGLSDSISNIINDSANKRNELLEGALSTNWSKLTSKITESGVEITDFEAKLKEVMSSHKIDVDTLIDEYGSLEKIFQNGAVSTDVLKEAIDKLNSKMVDLSSITKNLKQGDTGDDVTKIQEALVNIGAADFTPTGYFGTKTEAAIKSFQKLKGLKVTGIVDESTINALEDANNSTTKIIGNVDKLINKVTKLGGREKIIKSFSNVFKALSDTITPIKSAFNEIFPPVTVSQLTKVINKFYSFSKTLKVTEQTSDNLKRTFKGVFSVIDLFGKGIKAIITPIGEFTGSGIIGSLVSGFLSITASIGDFFTTLNQSTKVENFLSTFSEGLSNSFSEIATLAVPAIDKIKSFGDAFSTVGSIIAKGVGKFGDGIKSVFSWIKENVSISSLLVGLAGGGVYSLSKNLFSVVDTIKDAITDKISSLFDFGSAASGIKEQFSEVLDSVKDSLTAFTAGIKVASLVSIAVAIAILSASLKSISKIEFDDLCKSLGAIGVMFASLCVTLKTVTKTLSANGSKGLTKAGVSMIFIATAVNIFATALKKISGMSLENIGKGLLALGVGMAELVAAIKIIDGAKVSLSISVAIIALSEACKILADALAKFSALSWDEITRGLTAMGGSLLELSSSLAILSKVGGFGTLLSGTGILIAVQGLGDLADALKKFGKMDWDKIKTGLSAMGGALGELTISLSVLSKVGGFGSLLGATGLLIAVQSLDEISENLKKLGKLGWEEIGKGLSAMGGALGELTACLSILSAVGGFGAILGGTGILIAVQSLEPISTALSKIGNLSWEEIGKGLTGIGAALAELSIISGTLGSLTGFSGILGSTSLLIGVQGLGDLADALKKFGQMTFDEIGTGLVGMGGALTELAVVSGLLGNLGGLGAIIGSTSLLIGVQGLGDLADALKKFGAMNWDEIGTGLVAMGAALGETALGGLLNTFSGFGASAISKMAEPLGVLADSVLKWKDVTVPEGLSTQLGELADGVVKFNFSGWGAGAISDLGTPLGDLAESISKWKDVSIPYGLSTKLGELADGVVKFNFSGWGASAIGELSAPLGDLATSISKWKGIEVPSDIKASLEGLAGGVKAFNFSGWGADAISSVATPLGDLASAMKKWSKITIPSNIQSGLEGLAYGISPWSYVNSANLSGLKEPLKSFADGVKSWNNVTIPSSVQSGLEKMAVGVNACNSISTNNLSSVCDGIRKIGNTVTEISSVDFGGVSSKLMKFASSINNVSISTGTFTKLGTNIVNSFVSAINKGSSSAVKAGKSLVTSISSGIKSAMNVLTLSINTILTLTNTSIRNKQSAFMSSGAYLVTGLSNGIRSHMSSAYSASGYVANYASNGARGYYGTFYNTGAYLVSGFVSGIRSKISSAAQAAADMAESASESARKKIKVNSPSKVFYEIGSYAGIGFVNALVDYKERSYDAGSEIATSAKDGLNKAITQMSIAMDNIDNTPTIKPILDLTSIENGVGKIDGLLGTKRSIGISNNLGAISSMMNKNQNATSNDDIVSAIGKLQKTIRNNSGDSYVINGITYDDGTNVSSAIKELVRATKIGRRV